MKPEYDKTCSVFNLKENGLTFVRSEKYLRELIKADKNIYVYTPLDLMSELYTLKQLPSCVKIFWVDREDLDYKFFKAHNELYKDYTPPSATIGKNCVIHPSTVLDVDGIKFANCPDGRKLQFKHIGNVVIEDDVEVGPLCVIHRGTIDSTILKRGVKLASKINIGHNAIIGEDTVIASGAILGGSVIGKNCWIGMAAVVKQGIQICDNVVLGAMSYACSDIDEPGIYVGSPAKFLRPIKEGFNF